MARNCRTDIYRDLGRRQLSNLSFCIAQFPAPGPRVHTKILPQKCHLYVGRVSIGLILPSRELAKICLSPGHRA